MSRRILTVVSLCGLLSVAFRCDEPSVPRSEKITAEEILNHVKILSSDELEGRRAGTNGAERAANYVANEFGQVGLKPAGDDGSYFQDFEFIASQKLGPDNELQLAVNGTTIQFDIEKEYEPQSFSDNGTVKAEAVFVGYGISAPDLMYDDYAGVDVADRVVIALRFTPDGNDPHSDFNPYAPLRRKAMTAREKGAKGIIFVTGPLDADRGEKDAPVRRRGDLSGGRSGILVVSAKSAFADSAVAPVGSTLRDLQSSINSNRKPNSQTISQIEVTLGVDLIDEIARTSNVLGFLQGSKLGEEFVVIGAHYDHLGYGGEGSLEPDAVEIHNGADDNASGTAGLLELAQWFSAHRSAIDRSILFLSFGAEEDGLLGSAYYVKNPKMPLDRIVAMINLDMIGRLRDSVLIVGGAGTSPDWKDLLHSTPGAEQFNLKFNQEGFGPSDHASFYGRNIPVLFFFTNLHEDYHRPSDDWQKIRSSDEEQIVKYVRELALRIANEPAKPTFAKVEAAPPPSDETRTLRAYVGTIPDFSESGAGYKIGGVTPGSPAEKAGIKEGDVMVKFGGKEIRNIYDYTYVLQDSKPGDVVEVEVLRGDQRVTVSVTLESRSR